MKKNIYYYRIFGSFLLMNLIFSVVFAQNVSVKGTVTDESGLSLPGVNILEKGTLNGVVTDNEGRYSITLDDTDAILVASFIGYETQEIFLDGRANIDIIMKPSATSLEEVVVVGYGSQKRASLVGAISTAQVDEIQNMAATNLSNSLGGRISGVITRSNEGQPGNDDATILIRGRSTTNDASPLVLVDGVESSLNRINPNDIESFSVLKDASATAVYGVRGANGVILITTKRGRKGKPVITFNSQLRSHSIITFPDFLNAYDFARLYNEARMNDGNNPDYTEEDLELYRTGESPYTHPDVDWYNLMVRPSYPEHRHDISMSGGGDLGRYRVSAEYVSQSGAYEQWDDMEYSTNNAYDRINIRTNFDFDLHDNTRLQVNLMARTENINAPNAGDYFGGSRTGFWDNLVVTRPNSMVPHNPDGSFGNTLGSRNVERGYMELRQGGYRTTRRNTLEGNIRLEQDLDFLLKGLGGRIIMSRSNSDGYNRVLNESPASFMYNPIDSSYTQITRASLPSYSLSNVQFRKLNYIEAALTYENTFGGDHDLGGLFLYNINQRIFGSNPPASQLGFAGRLTYGYKNKYFAEFNLGYNGSDQFQSGNRFAFLPAGSAGWTISEEDFFQVDFINHLKVRGSYGTVANDRIGGFRYLYESLYFEGFPSDNNAAWNTGINFGINPDVRPHIEEGSMGNDEVTWEVAVKQNVGIDLWMFQNLFRISVDIFQEKRSNILARRNTITDVFGVSSDQLPPQNIGEVENKGIEMELRALPSLGEFNFNFTGNLSFARNKRVFFDEVLQESDYMNQTGKPIGQYFGYQWTGDFYSFEDLGYVWDDDAGDYFLPEDAEPIVPVPTDGVQPGDLMFVDRNDDGIIDTYDIGDIGYSGTPEFLYGFNFGVEFRGVSLNTFWQGAGNFTNNVNYLREFVNGAQAHQIHLGRWAYFPEMGIDTRETATHPRLGIDGSPQTRKQSTFTTFVADYLRLKNVELGYSLPSRWLENLKITEARVFVNGSNLLTFSEYDYIDPESPGGSASFYPQSKYYGGGLSVTF